MQQRQRSTSTPPHAETQRAKRFELRTGDERFGRGYTVGFLTFFTAAVAAFVFVVRSTSHAGRARSIAAFVAAIGGAFVFGIVYQIVQGIGFSVSASAGNWQRSTVLERARHPVRYWMFVLGVLVVAGAMLAFAVWVWMNTAAVAAWLARHPPTDGRD